MKGGLKQIGSLRPEDFARFGVWEYKPGPGGDETWVKPVRATLVSTLDGRVVAARVVLANGEARWALIGNVSLDNPRLTKHFLSLSIEDGGRWFHLARHHDRDYAERGPQALATFLGIPLDRVFPIAYDISARVGVESTVTKGRITAEPDDRLTRAEVIALAVL